MVDRKLWTGGMELVLSDSDPLNFFPWICMKLGCKKKKNGKPETKQQLARRIIEPATVQ